MLVSPAPSSLQKQSHFSLPALQRESSDLLRVEHICKTYGSGEAAVHALKDVSFSVPKGEFVAIVGESGSGKSTLLNMIGALDTPTSGRVYLGGKDTFAMTGNLDSQNSSEVLALLKKTARQYEQTVIMITHNPAIAHTADRVFQVSDGMVTDLGGCRV